LFRVSDFVLRIENKLNPKQLCYHLAHTLIPKRLIRVSGRLEQRARGLFQCNSIEEGYSGVVATAGTVKAVVEDPFFSVLKLNSHIAQAARNLRSARLHHDPAPPGAKPAVKHLVPDPEINMFFNSRFPRHFFRRRKGIVPHLRKVGGLRFHLPSTLHGYLFARSVPTFAPLPPSSPVDPNTRVSVAAHRLLCGPLDDRPSAAFFLYYPSPSQNFPGCRLESVYERILIRRAKQQSSDPIPKSRTGYSSPWYGRASSISITGMSSLIS
jgi:hypothetical protein